MGPGPLKDPSVWIVCVCKVYPTPKFDICIRRIIYLTDENIESRMFNDGFLTFLNCDWTTVSQLWLKMCSLVQIFIFVVQSATGSQLIRCWSPKKWRTHRIDRRHRLWRGKIGDCSVKLQKYTWGGAPCSVFFPALQLLLQKNGKEGESCIVS